MTENMYMLQLIKKYVYVAINSVYFITEHWFLCRVRHATVVAKESKTLAGTVSLDIGLQISSLPGNA